MFAAADEPARAVGLRLIAPDRPGYGLSDAMPGRTLADWAADAAQLMDHLGIARAPILAISGGGPYAVAIAAQAPERVVGLALVSPLGDVGSAHADAKTNAVQRAFFRGLPGRAGLLTNCAATLRGTFRRMPGTLFSAFRMLLSPADRRVLATPAAKQLILTMTAEAFRNGVEGAVSDMVIYSKPWGIDLSGIACPTNIWQGTADRIVPAALSFDLGQRLPHCVVHRLEGHGHFWVVAHVREVLEAMAQNGGQGSHPRQR